MIPVGYMAKRVVINPDWLKTDRVVDLYSVSNCFSQDFADYIKYWKHNGYWFFDSPAKIREVSEENNIDLNGMTMFYYECFELQASEDGSEWGEWSPEESFETNVVEPEQKTLEGFDVVSFSMGNSPECSYLSCNHMAEDLQVNKHCLLESFDETKNLIDQKVFDNCEPGPCRIFAVFTVKDA